MSLKDEIGLKEDFKKLQNETILNIYFTSSLIKKRADKFFQKFGITDVQFNLMMLLVYQSSVEQQGLTQIELSRMMLVNRANITSLIDRMEKAALVERTFVPSDRRCYIIKLTTYGKKIFNQVEKSYHEEVDRIMGILKDKELKALIKLLERIRTNL